jgi:thymidylate synthase
MWEAKEYGSLINKILHKGQKRSSRAGTAYSIFGEVIEIDLQKSGFPLLHGRKMFYEGVLGELAAMLRGNITSVKDFEDFGCNYWKDWANEDGSINVDYGNAWRDYNGVDQLQQLVDTLTNNPSDRRMLIDAWRPDRLAELSLPCCHLLYQWYVRDGKYLDMVWYQRSVDTMVGLPSDIILCAAWNIILAQQCGYEPGVIKLVLGDTHIYTNHIEAGVDYIRQLNSIKEHPKIEYTLDPKATVFNFRPSMLVVKNYNPKPAVKFAINV